jgi:hypothetical protein
MPRPRRQAKARTRVLSWPQKMELMIWPPFEGSEHFVDDEDRCQHVERHLDVWRRRTGGPYDDLMHSDAAITRLGKGRGRCRESMGHTAKRRIRRALRVVPD